MNMNETGAVLEDPAHVDGHRTEAELAFDEIETAVKSGQAVAAEEGASPAATHSEGAKLTPEEAEGQRKAKIEFLIDRARRQKRLGRAGLEKVVAGAASVQLKVTLFDISVGSSLERFVSQVDTAFHTVSRRGPSLLGDNGTEAALNELSSKIKVMADEAKTEREQVAVLLATERGNDISGEFLEPKYLASAVELDVNAKHRDTLKMITALKDYDKLISDLTVLEWNGKVDADRVDMVRARQKKLSKDVFIFANRALQALYRALDGRKEAPRTDKQSITEAALRLARAGASDQPPLTAKPSITEAAIEVQPA